MSTDIQYGAVVFSCDGCDDALETGNKDFSEAVAFAKAHWWVFRKENEEWKHYCAQCAKGSR